MDFVVEDVFAQIINGELPADIVYEEEAIVAFKDINPKARFHALMVPKINGLVTGFDVNEMNRDAFGRLFLAAKYVSDIEDDLHSYKLHMNVGPAGGQVVPRVHLHMLSQDYPSDLVCSQPTNTVYYEDDDTLAFAHENPMCEKHCVIQLKDPELRSALDVRETNLETFGHLFLVARQVAEQMGLEGYKLFMNVDPEKVGNDFACFHLLSPDYKCEL